MVNCFRWLLCLLLWTALVGCGDVGWDAVDRGTLREGGTPGKMRLVRGWFSTADPGPSSTATAGAKVRLLEGGFEMGNTLCNGKQCVTGGITP